MALPTHGGPDGEENPILLPQGSPCLPQRAVACPDVQHLCASTIQFDNLKPASLPQFCQAAKPDIKASEVKVRDLA